MKSKIAHLHPSAMMAKVKALPRENLWRFLIDRERQDEGRNVFERIHPGYADALDEAFLWGLDNISKGLTVDFIIELHDRGVSNVQNMNSKLGLREVGMTFRLEPPVKEKFQFEKTGGANATVAGVAEVLKYDADLAVIGYVPVDPKNPDAELYEALDHEDSTEYIQNAFDTFIQLAVLHYDAINTRVRETAPFHNNFINYVAQHHKPPSAEEQQKYDDYLQENEVVWRAYADVAKHCPAYFSMVDGAQALRDKMEAILEEYRLARSGIDELEDILAATAHLIHRLILLHPFTDGNARSIVFMLTNILLIHNGIAPAMIEMPGYFACYSRAECEQKFRHDIALGQAFLEQVSPSPAIRRKRGHMFTDADAKRQETEESRDDSHHKPRPGTP